MVASADLDRVSLVARGDAVRFREIGLDEAVSGWQAHQRAIRAAVSHPADLP